MGSLAEMFAAIGRAVGLSGQIVMWVVVGVAIVVVAVLVWQQLGKRAGPREATADESSHWKPENHEAETLLEDADRLAAEGRYEEATHLLLTRSITQIAAARPHLLEPSNTAREIAAMQALPQAVRTAFGTIAERVELSLFALRQLDAEDWQAARDAYSRFVFSASDFA